MIKTTLGNLLVALEALNKLAKLSEDGKLSFKTSYKLNKIIKKMQPDLDDYNKERGELANKYGEPTDDQGNFKITDVPNFNKYMRQLSSIEVELDNVFSFIPDDFEGVEGISFTDIDKLNDFFIDETVPIEVGRERKPIKVKYDN